MNSNIRTFYLYTVCFVTLCMIVSGVVIAINNIALYIMPNSYIFYENENSVYAELSDYGDDYSLNYDEIEKENYKTRKIKGAVVATVIATIGGIMYKYHWKVIEKEKNS